MEKYLLTPGPTPLPEAVRSALAKKIVHHRTPEFRQILDRVTTGLKEVFQTKSNIYIFAASGSGAMEAAAVNLLSPGDKAIVVKGGKFGERFAEICAAYNVEVVPIDVTWGEAVDPQEIKKRLDSHPDVKCVFTTLCETSTGVATDIKAVGDIVKNYPAVLVVDAISGLLAMELKTDSWFVDCVVAGSQKGLMLPPGLAFISLGPKAEKLMESSRLPKYYYDLKKYKKSQKLSDTPFTPAINLVIALEASLTLIKQEGLENVYLRHARLAEATHAAVKAMGLKVFSKKPANAVTAIELPEDIDGTKLIKLMVEKYAVRVAGGQAQLKGKIVRIAHMGYINQKDVLSGITALEKSLNELGFDVKQGRGAAAAEQILKKT